MAIQGFFTGDVKIRDLNGVLKAVDGVVEVATDAGTVTSVGLQVGTSGTDVNVANSPITSSGNITLNLPTASATNRGLLSSADWEIFSAKQGAITLTTTGNNGSATLTSGTLNIPTYTLAGLGGISLTSLSASSPLLYNNTTGAFSIQVANGSQNGYLSSTDWITFNSKQDALSGTGIVKSTGGTISYITDNSNNWNTAYNDSIVSAAVSGTSTKTLTLTQQDGGTVTASWSDADTGLTSVGVSMPSAFSVSNSPLTSNGTIAITGAGAASQYVRGDGTLANFPNNGGGGSSVSYYLNGSVNQGTFGGNIYYEMNKVPIIGTGTDFSISADGYIAQFITDAGDPALLNIPAGNWNFEMYFNSSSSGGTPSFYIELYKYNGSVFTLISSGSATPELITGGTAIDLYTTALAVPSTSLTITDRLAIRVYVTHSGKTITLHTEDNHLCQVITTFSTGITALNGLTEQVQYFQVGTSGTDFNISSATATHTFNLPTASATNRGALSSADWTTFNNKQNALTNPVTGTGTSGQVAFWNGTNTQTGDSGLFWDNTNKRLGIGTNTPRYFIDVIGSIAAPRVISFENTNHASQIRLRSSSAEGNVTMDGTGGVISGGGLLFNSSFNIFHFMSSGTSRMVFRNNNLLIGTTTDAGFRLDVNGTARFSNNITLPFNASTIGASGGGNSSTRFLGNTSAGWNGFAFGNVDATNYNFEIRTNSNFCIAYGALYATTATNNGTGAPPNPNASAVLQADSTTKGFLQPRMTTTQRDAISTPATGLSIYNTATNTIEFYNGTSWVSSNAGTGTTNTLPKFTGTSTIGNSNITDTGSLITLGSNTTIPNASYYQSLTSTGTTVRMLGINAGNVAYIGAIESGVISTVFNASPTSVTASFYTSGTEKVRIDTNGSVGIGTTSLAGFNLRASKNVTGAATSFGIVSDGIVQSDVTTQARGIYSNLGTAAASFTLTGLVHFRAEQGTIGVGSTVTSQIGYWAGAMNGSTNTQGFYGDVTAGANRWNLYMNSTANNYMAGSLGIGSTSLTGYTLRLSKSITGSTSSFVVRNEGTVLSDVTSDAIGFRNESNTQAAAFTLANYWHFWARQGSIRAGSAITSQQGFYVDSNMVGATNNYGFRGAIPSGANRWNIYMDGTAANYLAGVLNIGTTTLSGFSLDVNGTARVSGQLTANSFVPTSSTIPTNGMYLSGTNTLGFATNSTLDMTLDATGNLGLGVTPAAWGIDYKAYQVNLGSIAADNFSASDTLISSNVYHGLGTFRYIINGVASQYRQFNSVHSWLTAPSGTAGNAISFTQAMTLDASGRLGIGTISPAYRLEVNNSTGDNHIAAVGTAPSLQLMSANTSPANWGTMGMATATNNFIVGAAAGDLAIVNRGTTAGNILFGFGSTERMRLTSGGALCVGRTTAYSAGFLLNVEGNIYASAALNVGTTIQTGAPTGGTAQSWRLGEDTNTLYTATRTIRVEIAGSVYYLLAVKSTDL